MMTTVKNSQSRGTCLRNHCIFCLRRFSAPAPSLIWSSARSLSWPVFSPTARKIQHPCRCSRIAARIPAAGD